MKTFVISLEEVINHGRMDFSYYDPRDASVAGSVPTGQRKARLADVCISMNPGKTSPRGSYLNEGARILKVRNTTGRGINWNVRSYVSGEFYEKNRHRSQVRTGDILMLCAAHNRSYIGRCDIVDAFPEDVAGNDHRCCCVGELMIIRPDPEIIDPAYLIAYLRAGETQRLISQMVKGQSAHLYARDLGQLEVPLPPLEIQAEIGRLSRESEREYNRRLQEAEDNLLMSEEEVHRRIFGGPGRSEEEDAGA